MSDRRWPTVHGPDPPPVAGDASSNLAGGVSPFRLLVGGLSLGTAFALRALRGLEGASRNRPEAQSAGSPGAPVSPHPSQAGAPGLTETPLVSGQPSRPAEPSPIVNLAAPVDSNLGQTPPPEPTPAPLRQSLVGFLLEAEERVSRDATTLDRGIRETARILPGSGLPGSQRLSRTLAEQAARMEARGRQEVDRLAAIGLAEEHRAATAVDSAFRDPVAKSIDEIISVHIERIAESPEVRQMIREESTTLLEDLLDQVRDRASRADDRAERAARRMFRRGRPRPDTDAGAPAALAFGAESAASIAAPATPADTTTLADQPFAGPAIASPAGFVSRVIALALDIWVLAVSVGAAGFILFAVIGAFRPVASGIDLRAAVPAAMGALVTVLYFIVCWAAFGRTLGMALMGLKGLTWDGKRVSLLRAVLRYVGYLISVCFVCVGLLWVLFDNRRLGWHDHLARTRVIHVPRMIGHATSPASRSPAPAAADGP